MIRSSFKFIVRFVNVSFVNFVNQLNYLYKLTTSIYKFDKIEFELQAKLPLFNGRVVSWLVAAEGSVVSQSSHHLHHGDDDLHLHAPSELMGLPLGLQREAGVGETRPPSFQ